jgi:hypothetical protein
MSFFLISFFLVREPDAGNPPVRFDEREVETGHGEILGHRQPKGPGTRKASLHHRATSRLYGEYSMAAVRPRDPGPKEDPP